MKKLFVGFMVFAVAALVMRAPALASSTVVVTPSNTQGWSTADTRPGGAVNYMSDVTSPYPSGALQLTTDATTTSKAQYLKAETVALSSVTELSYNTLQVSGPSYADPSYQLPVYLNGGTSGFTTLVYEPYQNGTVVPGIWQNWNVSAGQFWSSRSVTCSNGSVIAGGGGAPFYTLSQLVEMCPNAVTAGFGVNIGSNNPSYVVETDGVNFNGTTYDFQLDTPTPTPTPVIGPPTNKDQCKNGGWQTFNNPVFRNQGQCVSYVERH